MASVINGSLFDIYCIPRAHRDATVAGHALPGIHMNTVIFNTEYIVRTILHATTAEHALVMVNRDTKFGWNTPDRHINTLPTIGSPARGMVMSSTSGSITLIAASSLDI